MITLLWCYEA